MFLKIHRKGKPEEELEVVRVSFTELLILNSIGEDSVYAHKISQDSNGAIPHGSIHQSLKVLREKQLVITEKETEFSGWGPLRTFYTRAFDFQERYYIKDVRNSKFGGPDKR